MSHVTIIVVGNKTYGTLSVSEDCYNEIAAALKANDRSSYIDEENKVIDLHDLGLLLDTSVSSKGDC